MLPMKIDLFSHELNNHLTLDYQEANIPQHIEDQLFILTPPVGVKMYSLKELPQSPLMQPQ
jgi:hypothetical protein